MHLCIIYIGNLSIHVIAFHKSLNSNKLPIHIEYAHKRNLMNRVECFEYDVGHVFTQTIIFIYLLITFVTRKYEHILNIYHRPNLQVRQPVDGSSVEIKVLVSGHIHN